MIFRLEYCNKFGDAVRVDITTPGLPTVVEVEGAGDPFRLKYTPDVNDKSFRFLTTSANINIYETPEFNIDILKTSSETDIKVEMYINGVKDWVGFVLPDFFSKEIRGNAIVSMTASDRISTLKGVTLSYLPAFISIRDLAVMCLAKTGLDLPLNTMVDFLASRVGFNDFFRSEIPSQRLVDNKGRSISCYDILSSILVTSNSFLEQRKGKWYIINKLQHELGEGELYSSPNTHTTYSEVAHNFSEITKGAMRTIVPVAASVGIFHEFGGGRLHPDNYDFSKDLTGWNPVGGFTASIDNRQITGYSVAGSGIYTPTYGEATDKKYLVNNNAYQRNTNPIYLESDPIDIPYSGLGSIDVELDINGIGPKVYPNVTWKSVLRIAIIAVSDSETLTLDHGGKFIPMPSTNPPVFEKEFDRGVVLPDLIAASDTKSMKVKGVLEVGELGNYKIKVRIYGSGSGNTVIFNTANVVMRNSQEVPKGNLYKREQGSNFTKTHEIETSIFGDYITGGLNGYFYDYPIDDTSSLYSPYGNLREKWIDPTDPNREELPLLQHAVRQKGRMFSVAHDLIRGEVEMVNFDPLAIFVDCSGKRYSIVSAEVDFLRSTVNLEIEEIAYRNLIVRDFIYSYFGEGESGIKSVGGIASGSGSGGGGTGGGLTPEQLEILSWWKKDPDRENTIFTEMNAYSKLELSAYGAGDGGGSGGGIIETVYGYSNLGQTFNNDILTDTFNAYTINRINTRLIAVESGSATTINTTGTGNAITSISKAGTVITAEKGLTFALASHTHTIAQITGLQGALDLKATQSDIDTAIDEIEIGGRNLNIASNIIDGEYFDQSTGVISNEYPTLSRTPYIEIEPNTRYTVNSRFGLFQNLRVVFFDEDKNLTRGFVYGRETSIKRIYTTIANEKYITLSGSNNLGDEKHPKNYGIFKGNVGATDWTPASEDQVSDWNTTDETSFSYIKNKPTQLSEFTDNIGVGSHISNTSNPHNVTKAQVGLGNVLNVASYSKTESDGKYLPLSGGAMSGTITSTIGGTTALLHKASGTGTALARIGASTFDKGIGVSNTGELIFGDWSVVNSLSTEWDKVYHTGNFNPAKYLPLTGGTLTGNLTAPTFIGSLTGNAASATKLQTARTIWGQSFDGTGNISGALSGVTTLAMTGALSGATTITASTSVTTPKVIFNAVGWSMEQVGSELQMKHNNVLKMRFTSTGSIVAVEEITAFG